MKVVVVGKGGREHALVTALKESATECEIYCFPGSDAINEIAKPVPVSDLHGLIDWMSEEKVDLCLAGEESYLVKDEGLANLCERASIPCWGPHKESARLEASKEFAKEFLNRHGIPTGKAVMVSNLSEAWDAIGTQYPTVLKFDGLAAGKGVAVCPDKASAEAFLNTVFVEKRFGEGRLLVEEFMTGPEVSIFAALVDDKYLVLAPARDYKRLGNADDGPNTGGMGAVSSRNLISQDTLNRIVDDVVKPTVKGLRSEHLPYRGFLYFGLMLTPDGPRVIEYNCRFGDPECQAVMPLLSGDLFRFCLDGARGKFSPELVTFSNGWSVCVVLASAGYPDSSHSGDVITGLDKVEDVRVYHAGTRRNEKGEYETNGGRVLAVVATGGTLDAARTRAHKQASRVDFQGSQRRCDIGFSTFE